MKSLIIAAALIVSFVSPAFAGYTPPNNDGPGSSRGSGTRLLRPLFGLVECSL